MEDKNAGGAAQQPADVTTATQGRPAFVRPVRDTYTHKCGNHTKMSTTLAESFARNPRSQDSLPCSACYANFPLSELVWKDTKETVGS